MASSPDDTPAMRQYHRFKEQHPQCVLFFRMGDFYEMFHDDAKLAHRVLGVTLTQRTQGVPMAGVPHHAVESYLRRMIQSGYRVAVCEQMEDPAQAKGIVKREVTRVVTPGTITDAALLEEARENPLLALSWEAESVQAAQRPGGQVQGRNPGSEAPLATRLLGHSATIALLAWAELSTGAFRVMRVSSEDLSDELARIGPRELLCDEEQAERVAPLAERLHCALTKRPGWQFRQGEAVQTLRGQFGVSHLEGFGFNDEDPLLSPAGAVVAYLLETQKLASSGDAGAKSLAHLRPPRLVRREQHLVIDETSLRSLEVERTTRSGRSEGTLLGVFSAAPSGSRTAMGKRLLRQWLCYPLRDRTAIQGRQRVVGALMEDPRLLEDLRKTFDEVQDVQRIGARVAVGRATPRDVVALGTSTRQIQALVTLLAQRPAVAAYHERLARVAVELGSLAQRIADSCVESPPGHLREGGLFKDGCDAPLDEFRGLQRDSHDWLAQYQRTLIEETGIASLKVGFNKVFGYYIELTAAQRNKVADRDEVFRGWVRKQTLKNCERFITPELKEFEGKVLTAQSRAIAREQELFAELCLEVQKNLAGLDEFATSVAELDVLGCFAHRAGRFRYVKPELVEEPVLRVESGRHPVLDELLGERLVPNDLGLGGESGQAAGEGGHSATSLALITGPNMAGKSTYIRQAALLTLLAHTGSFVPATRAVVGLCDRIFTRIGASDELHSGRSTFMVEMTETANLCHHATPESLVILDEIGRGTSTLDGLALAWAITEHLAAKGCRTLFATHYHELTELAEQLPGVMNLNVTVREWKDQVVFLHRIAPGRADKSYGIHVAKIAGLPPEVVQRAQAVLAELEGNHAARAGGRARKPSPQLSLFTEYVEHPALAELRQADLNALSPMQAFDLLRKLRDQVEKR